jgi:hypothetical protein
MLHMNTKILKVSEINFSKMNFSKPIYTQDDIIVPVYYNDHKKSSFVVQIPGLILNDSYKDKKGYIIMPLNAKNNNETKSANDFFKTLDKIVVEKIKQTVIEMKSKGKITSNELSYKSVVNELEDDDSEIYKNGIVRYRVDHPDTKIFDENKMVIEKDNYSKVFIKGSFIKAILEIAHLVINPKTGSITLYIKTLQLKVQNENIDKVDLKEYSFDDNSDNECDISNHEVKEAILNTQTDVFETEKYDSKHKQVPVKPNQVHDNHIQVTDKPKLEYVLKTSTSVNKPQLASFLSMTRSEAKPNKIHKEPAPTIDDMEFKQILQNNDNNDDDVLDNIVDIDSDTDMTADEVKNYFTSIS